LVGFGTRQAVAAIGVLLGLVAAAALVAVAQALLSPHLLGLSALRGRFGELYRLAAFFGDPNVFAAFLSASIPFALFGVTGLRTTPGRRIALAGAFLLVLALWLSFSRGGWLGAIVGFALAAFLAGRRPLRVGLLVMAVALVVALAMPRNLLCDTCEDQPDLLGSTFGRIGTVGGGDDLRVLFIENAVPIIADHPLLGVGPGRYGGAAADIYGTPVYATYRTDRLFVNPTQRTVDNFWLHLVVESGVLGVLAYLTMVMAPLRAIIRRARTAAGGRGVALAGISGAVIGLAINALTTMLLEANSVAFLFWFLLGIGSQLANVPDAAPVARDPLARTGLELAPDGDLPERPPNEPQVKPEGTAIDVGKIQCDTLFEADPPPGSRLPEASHPRDHRQSSEMPRLVDLYLIRYRRARTNEAHLATHDVDQLRQFVEMRSPQEAPQPGDARVGLNRKPNAFG
jgi:O-antigen ligase